MFGGAALIATYLIYSLYNVLFVSGILSLKIIIVYSLLLLFFSLNTAWLSLSFMTALAGFLVITLRAKRSIAGVGGLDMSKPMESKTAILICTYNEAPERIFGLALATVESLAAAGMPRISTSSSSATPPAPTSGCRKRPHMRRC